ncbi:hypothetical protein GCM10025865_24600 [Paraoerskovia sediminicola]|uniref:WXG100 family type VII secretion target n=1 Tax=Paraoerskovia sediminicola TaxID=1138587 RepID=A0ABM8G504_9CELL|nr:hypothetical protein [Paraoerskovia sediminicola]BDZ43161.1 hypothetical protein GCM10025865_24600 [Paraoerskovia sediminicola]
MIYVPPLGITSGQGSPAGIRDLAVDQRDRAGDLDDRVQHVARARTALDGNHADFVSALRSELAVLPSRYDAVAEAYEDVAVILDDYADAVEKLLDEEKQLEEQVASDTSTLGYARESCLATDPSFPGYDLPWNFAPSPWTAPELSGLGHWHSAITTLESSRAALAAMPERRQTLDETTAQKLRAVEVSGPGMNKWMSALGVATVLGKGGAAAYKVGKNAWNIATFTSLAAEFGKAATAAGSSPAARSAMTFIRGMQETAVKGTGTVPAFVTRLAGVTRLDRIPGVTSALGTAGKLLGPIGGGLQIYDGVNRMFNSQYTGTRKVADQIVGGVGVVGGTATLLIAVGAIGATGIGAPIALGAAVIVGAWALGNLVYDHWDDITGFASKTWDTMVAGHKYVAQKTAEVLHDAGSAIVSTASDAAGAVGDTLSSAGNAIADTGGKALSKAAGFVGGLFG